MHACGRPARAARELARLGFLAALIETFERDEHHASHCSISSIVWRRRTIAPRAVLHHHFGRHGPPVVVRRHDRAVRARVADREQVADLDRRQRRGRVPACRDVSHTGPTTSAVIGSPARGATASMACHAPYSAGRSKSVMPASTMTNHPPVGLALEIDDRRSAGRRPGRRSIGPARAAASGRCRGPAGGSRRRTRRPRATVWPGW